MFLNNSIFFKNRRRFGTVLTSTATVQMMNRLQVLVLLAIARSTYAACSSDNARLVQLGARNAQLEIARLKVALDSR